MYLRTSATPPPTVSEATQAVESPRKAVNEVTCEPHGVNQRGSSDAKAAQPAQMQAQMEYDRQMAPYLLMQQQLQLQAQSRLQRQQADAYRLQLQERAFKARERSVLSDTIRSGDTIMVDPNTGAVVPFGR